MSIEDQWQKHQARFASLQQPGNGALAASEAKDASDKAAAHRRKHMSMHVESSRLLQTLRDSNASSSSTNDSLPRAYTTDDVRRRRPTNERATRSDQANTLSGESTRHSSRRDRRRSMSLSSHGSSSSSGFGRRRRHARREDSDAVISPRQARS